MAGVVLIGILILMFLGWMFAMGYGVSMKRLFISYALILISYHLYVSYSCGANSADVKVMKPMAEAVSSYIIKNGIPKSLEDIPNLPYELEGCERERDNKKCKFLNYQIKLYRFSKNIYGLDLTSIKNRTIITYSYDVVGNRFSLDKNRYPIIGSQKDTGICNPMRQ